MSAAMDLLTAQSTRVGNFERNLFLIYFLYVFNMFTFILIVCWEGAYILVPGKARREHQL